MWRSRSRATRFISRTRPSTTSPGQGRFTLGLGTQIRTQIEKRFGADFDRPVARMAELVGALRAIFETWSTASGSTSTASSTGTP